MRTLLITTLLASTLTLPAPAEDRPRKDPGKPGSGGRGGPKILKPKIDDTVKATIYADNWFQLYINGTLIATDSITFIPHNVVSVDILPEYPMTIAVVARDNADPDTGLEYDDTNIGDGGLVLKFGDGTVTDASWKVLSISQGPLGGDKTNPKTAHQPIPEGWHLPGFDDSDWAQATAHSEEAVGPKQPYYDHDFEGAKWIWATDLALDNTVLFRKTVPAPPDGSPLPKAFPRGKIDAEVKAHHQQ